MSEGRVHEIARKGFGEGTNELYDRARPSYPSDALSHIRKAVGDGSSINVVEIGSGTGIFTRALLAHPEWKDAIAELRAVEPSEGMRNQFKKGVHDARVSVAEGTFDSTGVPDGWADLIVIAQAYHWCPDHEAAVKEFARVLKPTGVVSLIWNLEDREAAGWVAQLREILEEFEQGTPQFRLTYWRALFDAPSYPLLFRAPEETEWSYALPTTPEKVIERALSKSYITLLPEPDKQAVKDAIAEVVKRGDGKVWIHEAQGVFQYPYRTSVVLLRRS